MDDCSHKEIQREKDRVEWITAESEEAMPSGVCDYSNDTVIHKY